jgi:hypothetical protein
VNGAGEEAPAPVSLAVIERSRAAGHLGIRDQRGNPGVEIEKMESVAERKHGASTRAQCE